MRADAGRARVEIGAVLVRDMKFFLRVTECWLNTCASDVSKKINASENLWYNGVEEICQPKSFTGPNIMSLSSWGPHVEWLITFILVNKNLVQKLPRAFNH